MKISVKNLGPIKNGTVNLDERFTVFVGYNNSGKTYMANVIWSFYHHYLTTNFSFENEKTLKKIAINNYQGDIEINYNKSKSELEKFTHILPQEIINDFFTNSEHPSFKNFKLKLSLGDLGHKKLNIIWGVVENRTNDIFIHQSEDKTLFDILIAKKANENYYTLQRQEHLTPFNRLNNLHDAYGYVYGDENDNFDLLSIVDIFHHELLTRRYTPYFLPANRIFYPSFYKYVYQAKKEENDILEESFRRGDNMHKNLWEIVKKPYHRNTDELLDNLFNLKSDSNPNSEYQDLLIKLETIVGGKFILKNAEGIGLTEIILRLNNGKEIDMNFASSSNNQLAVLYLYLKYFCNRKDNLLIIDEPEENLHPNHQAALAKLLVQFANRNNNKVIVTTHSSFFTDCINNYIRLAHLRNDGVELPDDIRKDMLSGMEDYSLKGEDFGVYFFDGERIKQYKTQKYGVYFEDFTKAEIKMKDMTDRLNGIIYENEFSHV